MNNISEKILNEIRNKNILPKPRWKFLLKNYFIWAMFVFTILIGSLAVSVSLFLINDYDWSAYQYIDKGMFEYIIFGLPYFWLLFIFLFAGLSYFNFKHTKKGYRYHAYIVVLVSIGVSLLFGFSLNAMGLGEKIDKELTRVVPSYERLTPRRTHIWQNPENGRLSGKIIFILDQQSFKMQDLDKKEWIINKAEVFEHEFVKIEINEMIRIVGEQKDENNFKASRILPWINPSGGQGLRGFRR